MKTTYYLKAADEAELNSALQAAGLLTEITNEDGSHHSFRPAAGIDLDVIGTIHKPTSVVDEFGAPVMEPTPGFHANLMAELTDEQIALLPVVQAPATPYRVWA